MKEIKLMIQRSNANVIFIMLALSSRLFVSTMAGAHGGKEHEAGQFTGLKALQEATKLYDRLIANGKLVEGWETELVEVKISTRERKGKKEFVVTFQRSDGDPNRVYIFFSEKGKYAGSNFSGK